MTVAQLGLAVDSSQVVQASPALDKMTASARAAEAAATQLGAASRSGAAGTAAATAASRMHAVALQAEAAASRMVASDTRMLGFQLNDIVVSLASGMNPAMVALQQGSQISQIGLRGLTAVIGPMLPALGLAAAALAAIGINLAAVTTEINKNQKIQVGWFDVLKAGFEVLGDSIKDKTKPAFDWLGSIWDTIAPKFADNITAIIKNFDLAFRNIKTEWQLLPAALGDSAIGAANNVIKAVEDMLNKSRAQIVLFLSQAGAALGPVGGGLLTAGAGVLANAGDIHLGQIANPYAGSGDKLQASLAQNYLDVSKTDPLGAIGDRARKDKLAAADDAAKKLGKTISGPLTDGIDKLTAKANVFAEAITGAFSNMGTTLIDAFKKGGDVAQNVLNALLDKVGQVGESLLNSGLNSLLGNIVGSAFAPATGGALGKGLWGSAIFAGVHHGGGVAGYPSVGRMVPSSMFDNAARYHSGGIAGLAPDEIPAILQRGERIVPANGNAANLNAPIVIEVRVSVDDNGKLAVIARQEGGRAAQVVVQQTVPQMIASQAPAADAAARRNRIVG